MGISLDDVAKDFNEGLGSIPRTKNSGIRLGSKLVLCAFSGYPYLHNKIGDFERFCVRIRQGDAMCKSIVGGANLAMYATGTRNNVGKLPA